MIMSVRLWLMGGSMPLFSEQDNPASFSPHLLTRSVSNSHARTKQTQTHQLSTFPVANSGNRKKAKQNSSELADNFVTHGRFHSILLSLYILISCEHGSWFKLMFSFKFDHTGRLLLAARQNRCQQEVLTMKKYARIKLCWCLRAVTRSGCPNSFPLAHLWQKSSPHLWPPGKFVEDSHPLLRPVC